MDKTTLVMFSVRAGLELLQELVDEGFDVKAAYWLYLPAPDAWRLQIALPMYDVKGPLATYNCIDAALSSATAAGKISDGEISLFDITAVSPKDALVRALSGTAIKSVVGYIVHNGTINGMWVDDAYVYPIPDKSEGS